MSTYIQPFNTIGNRLIKAGFGDSGTLAQIYAAGLADPANDNLFAMPAGNLRFTGATSWGDGASRTSAAVEFYQNKAAIALASPPAYDFASLAFNNSGVGGGGCGVFHIDELNDPAWDGNFQHISGITSWIVERANASNSPSQTSVRTSATYGSRTYDPNGQSPHTIPNAARNGFAMEHAFGLYNPTAGGNLTVELLTGYGEEERLLYATQNGVNAQWVTHWNNNAALPAAGDGPAWAIDTDGRFGRFNPGAAIQAYQRGANQATSAWGWRLFGQDATTALKTILDVNTDGGTLNGNAIPTLFSGSQVIENYLSPEVDLTVLTSNIPVVPARVGMVFVPREVLSLTTQVAGAFTSPPAITVKSGAHAINGAAPQNLPTVQQFDKGNFAALALIPAAGNGLIANTPIVINVTTAAVGVGMTYKCTYAIKGYWQALP